MCTEAAEEDRKGVRDGCDCKAVFEVALNVPDTIVDERHVERFLLTVPVPFCYMWCIKDARRFAGDKAVDMVKRLHLMQHNVSFVQTLSPENRAELKHCGNKATKALRNIYRGDELYQFQLLDITLGCVYSLL